MGRREKKEEVKGRRATTAQWKMTHTQDQASKTGLTTSGQEPDFNEDHLLTTGDRAPGLQAHSTRTRPPPFEGLETVDELDDGDELLNETKEDGASLSDLDEALSDRVSLHGDESPFNTGPPNLQELVRLGQGHCCMSCVIRNEDGVKTPSANGEKIVINDMTWNSMTWHSLGRIKDRVSLFEFVKKLIRKSQEAAFNQQSNLMHHFLCKRHYTGTYSEEYCCAGLLSRLQRS